MAETEKPLLIKRYASRRLYNTETSDYVTLEDVAGVIRKGRDVQIIDLKSGDDLTRQYLLQIIADHESRGETVLPVDILTDLVRSYATQTQNIVPQLLAQSFEFLRESQSRMMDSFTQKGGFANFPGFEMMRAQQEAFFAAMGAGAAKAPEKPQSPPADRSFAEGDLADIRTQLQQLQEKLAELAR